MREQSFEQQNQLQSVNYQQNNSASRQQGNRMSNETGIPDRLKTIVEYSAGLSQIFIGYDRHEYL